jgi:ATP-dependent exoDNAse (exonuclease V) beta subunit
MLQQPAIRAALSTPDSPRGKTFEVWRERPFVIRWDDALLAGKFDRVVITRDGSRVLGAEVIDFKTDAIPADDPARIDVLTDHYRPQIKAYRDAVARLTGIDASRVSARLLFVAIGSVKEL